MFNNGFGQLKESGGKQKILDKKVPFKANGKNVESTS